MNEVVLLNRVNAFPDVKHRRCDGWCLHREGCAVVSRELRQGGVEVEDRGPIVEVAATFNASYGFEAGYGNAPGEGWDFDIHVQHHPCVSKVEK